MDAIYFLYSAFSCLIVFGILCLIWDEHLMKIKAFLLLLCMFINDNLNMYINDHLRMYTSDYALI